VLFWGCLEGLLSNCPFFVVEQQEFVSSGESLSLKKERNKKSPYTIHKVELEVETNTQTEILPAETESAICVQRLDDSLSLQFTLHIAFRCVLHRCESQDIHR